MSSLMFGKLFLLHRRLRELGGRLVLCAPTPNLAEVFETLDVPRVIPVYATEPEAVQGCA
jgi:anti-anti-sigma regulatory factor